MDAYNPDTLMISVYRNLCQDMRAALGHVGQSETLGASMSKDVKDFREKKFVLHDNLTPYQYKWCMQVNSLLKRYVFQKDVLTPDEREELTNAKFVKLQETLAKNYWRQRSTRCHEVLRRTRKIVRQVLSGFCPQGLYSEGRFGTKATVGCPASSAYLDEKLMHRDITGSAQHLEWLTSLTEGDELLTEITEGVNRREVTRLAQVNVPKKCDIDRGINPNTLVGSYYSSALGEIVTQALLNEGLDIRRLQHRHGILARRASISRKWVTADLSDASHGFLSHLINSTMPREWYRAIMFGVIRNVEVAGVGYRLESIMTMGIGFTFPVQTLLFYCLLKALCSLTGIQGLVSVYGDDLIYPRKLHPFVVATFNDLGFKLNLDKTFVQSHFRESCGSDFFKGVEVRPFAPEGTYERMGRVKYAAFCYKLMNGLLRRWNGVEILHTINLLKFEICRCMGSLYIVPQHFPDHSGWKCACSEYSFPSAERVWWFPVAKWFYCSEVQRYEFPLITLVPGRHYVAHMAPYYWETLRAFTQREMPHIWYRHYWAPVKAGITLATLPLTVSDLPPILGKPTFKWGTPPNTRKRLVKCQGGVWRKRKYAHVASKDDNVARYTVSKSSKVSAFDEKHTP